MKCVAFCAIGFEDVLEKDIKELIVAAATGVVLIDLRKQLFTKTHS